MMLIGGGAQGGIHGAHLGPDVHIRYAAQDKKRQTIPWVEYTNCCTPTSYLSAGIKADAVPNLPIFEMQCVDCHNRAAHQFEDPDHAVDQSMDSGLIPISLPFVKKTGVELIKAVYQSDEEAARAIPAGLVSFYQKKYPDLSGKRTGDIQAAGQPSLSIYQRNVFADLKRSLGGLIQTIWVTSMRPGASAAMTAVIRPPQATTIPQDCDTCHKALAMKNPRLRFSRRLAWQM